MYQERGLIHFLYIGIGQEILEDLLSDYGDFFDKLMAFFMLILWFPLIYGGTLFLAYGAFCLADSVGMPPRETVGYVSSKWYSPETTYITYVNAGNNVNVPVVNTIPESWHVQVKVEQMGEDDVSVNPTYFNWVQIGQQVRVEYVTGRFSGGFYLQNILPGK